MRDDGKEITMKLRKLIQSLKRNEEKSGIGNRLVYAINSNKKCKIIVVDYTNIKSGINLKPIPDKEKKEEENKILSKEIIDNNLFLVDNGNYTFPVITLDAEDIQKTAINYLIIDSENKELIKGRKLTPLLFYDKKNELLVWQDKIEIKREHIDVEVKISKDRNILILNDGKNYLAVR